MPKPAPPPPPASNQDEDDGAAAPNKQRRRRWPWVVLGLVVVLVIAGELSNGQDQEQTNTAPQSTTTVRAEPQSTTTSQTEPPLTTAPAEPLPTATTQAEPQPTTTPQAESQSTTTVQAVLQPIVLTGSGNALRAVQLNEGRYAVEASVTDNGGDYFGVKLTGEGCYELIAFEFGSTAKDSTIVNVSTGLFECEPGDMDFEIDATGSWTITVTPR